uniref:Uncharacterized protein n=1 Tax=Colobus angolensis palliatus TaxID=336983 RepID=A0A2K5H9X3_COLAP
MNQSVVGLSEIQRGPTRKSGSFNHQRRSFLFPHKTIVLEYPLRLESIDFK